LGYTFRHLTPADADRIMGLQYTYQKKYPKATIIPADVYLSPPLSNGENVICAFDDDGKLKGYTVVTSNIAQQADVPHTLWSIVKADPALSSPRLLQEKLFEKALTKARELVKPYPSHEVRLMFQHHTSEDDAIRFLVSKGCVYVESTYHMMCDLSREPVAVKPPDGISTRFLNIDDAAELQAFLEGRNECFPWRAATLENWKYFFSTVIGKNGKVIIALENGQLMGSITISWNEDLNKKIGIEMGETDDVYVRAPWRQRNIAAYMISLGLNHFKEAGLKFGHLEVRGTNENALKLYQKMGYVVGDETRLFCLKL
jgi:ribosomal protein S18 acetylase RimI-like enzyme